MNIYGSLMDIFDEKNKDIFWRKNKDIFDNKTPINLSELVEPPIE